jgi:hypothetical protein
MEIIYITIFAACYKLLYSTAKMFVSSPTVNAVINEEHLHGESKKMIQALIPLLPVFSIILFMSNNVIRESIFFNLAAIFLCLLSGEYFFINKKIHGSVFCFHSALMVGAIHFSMLLMALMNVYVFLAQTFIKFLGF